MFGSIWLAAFFISLLTRFPLIVSQATNATCLTTFQWASNSHNQSPCQVASALLAVCSGSYDLLALPDATHYAGPSAANANACQCNTVTYSLVSACGACQARSTLSWSVWSANCAQTTVNSLPETIPSGLLVPGWAYLDVVTSDGFNITLAKQNANLTESSAAPTPTQPTHAATTALPPSITPHTTSQAPQATSVSADSSNASSSNRADVIGGSIVGGVLGTALIMGLVWWAVRRRQRRAAEIGHHLESPRAESQPQVMSQYLANTTHIPTASTTTSINNTSLVTPGIYVTPSPNMSSGSVEHEHSV